MKENPSKHQRFQKMREMIADGEKKLTFELKVDKSIGFFSMKPILESDGNKRIHLAPDPYDKAKYYNKDLRISQMNAFGELFLITKPKLKWKILKENKKIGIYNCIKATTEITVNSRGKKRIITAWFTPQIPLPFGPLGYDGLPGLILELEVYKKIYYAKKITLNPKKEIEIKELIKGVKVSEKEFQSIGRETTQKVKKNRGL